jgi:chromosomal replication initiation ATPase DnaA
MLYVYFACLKTTSLVTAIGARIGKDHATVIYYRNRAKDLISVKDSWLMPAYHQISSMLVQKGYYNNLTSTQVT